MQMQNPGSVFAQEAQENLSYLRIFFLGFFFLLYNIHISNEICADQLIAWPTVYNNYHLI